ncbi:MAG: hypothetical protein ABSE73_00040 [Planctomycetota bacterium]
MIPILCLTKNSASPALLSAPDRAGDSRSPPNGIHYLLAKSGIYKEVKNAFYSARVKVNGISHLEDTKDSVELHVPKLPLVLLRQAEAFFVAAYNRYHSEAVVVLLVSPASGQWRLEVPDQKVEGGSLHVAYDPTSVAVPGGFEIFGTIHSHASAGAFHSSTDDRDEACSDGLHITVGNVDKPIHSYAARWMICGQAFPAEIEAVVETPALPAIDPAWLEKIHEACLPPFEVENLWGDGPARGIDMPGIDPDIPDEMQAEYEDFMWDAHQRFVDRLPRR